MENPASWGPAEHAVEQALQAYDENQARPPGERTIGLSLNRQLTDALRREGLLREGPPPEASSAAFAAFQAIKAGQWDEHLFPLLTAIKARLEKPEARP